MRHKIVYSSIRRFAVLLFVVLLSSAMQSASGKTTHHFAVGDGTFLMDGKPFTVKAAEVHYTRIPRPYWEHRIKMCKALGMNTLCIYIFWNAHESQPGVFDFTGQNDVAAFVRLAQRHGMYVIVRPGPYVCAEWEMGGLPWWLLCDDDIRLRERDPRFLEAVGRFEHAVADQLVPLAIENGGPIIMVQVENEYGSYGEDKPYVSAIRDSLRSVGWDKTVLFQCDWSSNFTKNGLDDLVWTMNFGTGADVMAQFTELRRLRPQSPLMCSEYWSGWFDGWGRGHETRDASAMVDGLSTMLDNNISFSLYMTHGGTSFGHWAGANSPGFKPDCTSYDYDAPISEAGHATPKYYALRDMLSRHSDTKLPAVPRPYDVISIPEVTFDQMAPLFDNVPAPVHSDVVQSIEKLGLGYGTAIYSCTLPAVPAASLLRITEPHDFVTVYLDGRYVGKVYRGDGETSVQLPSLPAAGSRLELVVEAMGRINFGRAIADRKGITERVELLSTVDGHAVTYDLRGWDITLLDDTYDRVAGVNYRTLDPTTLTVEAPTTRVPQPATTRQKVGYYRTTFRLSRVGDTYLDLSTWGKGLVWVNGHALGRFWRVGPQQTLYLPGCWLKKGDNEIIIMDIVGPERATVSGVVEPIYDQLRLERPATHRREGETLQLDATKGLAAQWVAPDARSLRGWQTIAFPSDQTGRYLCVEALNNVNGDELACIAELYALDANGQRISREPWTVYYADSEENERTRSTADHVFDLQESTFWSTVRGVPFPHAIVIDLGDEHTLSGIQVLPRAEQNAPGVVSRMNVYLSREPFAK